MNSCAPRRRIRLRKRPCLAQRALTGALAAGLSVVACGEKPAPEGHADERSALETFGV